MLYTEQPDNSALSLPSDFTIKRNLRTTMRFICYLFISFLSFSAAAQEASEVQVTRSDSMVRIDGEKFLVHKVKPRQTLFSVAKAYGMTLSRLVFSNPGVLEGIQPGQLLHIPMQYLDEIAKDRPKEPVKTDGGFIVYEVPAKTTLYSIAKEHNTTVSALMEVNPFLADGLKVGSTIRIPVQRLMSDDRDEKVLLQSRYAATPINHKTNTAAAAQQNVGGTASFKVVAMLPFFLNENDSLLKSDGLMYPEVFNRSEMALQFYSGLLLALDSIRTNGVDAHLKVYDTQNSETKVSTLLSQGILDNADLIIGPFYNSSFTLVSAKAKELGIPIVSPTIQGIQAIQDNPMVFKVIPTEEQMMVAMGRYLSKLRGTNNLVVHFGKPEEQTLLWRFRRGLDAASVGSRISFPSVNAAKGLRDSVFHRLSSTLPNHVLFITRDEAKVASLVRTISSWTEKMDITAYGLSDWPGFKNVEMDYFDIMHLHVPEAFRVDYEDEMTQKFIQTYRRRYDTEPATFAFRGFDIGIHFLRALPGIRAEGPSHMLKVKDRGLQCDFHWVQEPNHGFENSSPRVVNYTDLQVTFDRP